MTLKNKWYLLVLLIGFISNDSFALDQTLTVPAEKSEGVVITLPAGSYKVDIAGGAAALFYPIHPAYSWLYALCLGAQATGGQDEPDLGTLYFDPVPKVTTQSEAETAALEALKKNEEGTSITFSLEEETDVRFWVSDFDYSDNSGSLKVRIKFLPTLFPK